MQAPKSGYRPPRPAFPGQDLSGLMSRLTAAPLFPALRLNLFTVRGGYFATGPDHAGMVFTADGTGVRETCLFSLPARQGNPRAEIGEVHDTTFDEVFVGYDWAWINWYHWLCFALPKSAIAAGLLSPACRITLPAWAPAAGFGEAAWRQSIAAFGLDTRVTVLPPGVWRARKIRLLWTEPAEPTDFTLLAEFAAVFDRLQRRFRPDPAAPKRILIARDDRLTPEQRALLDDLAPKHGFIARRFETMDFDAQAHILFNADLAAGVHGAGMANILFGRHGLGVLELNLDLDGGQPPRPWFCMLANSRRQRYATLNLDAGELTRHNFDAAIERLTARDDRNDT